VGNGWYRCSIRFNDTISNIRLYPAVADNDLTGASGNIYIQNAQLVKGDQPKNYLPTTDRLNLPRLNYPVYGGCPSLLVEPQRQNLITYSQDFSQWSKTGTTSVSSNDNISPEGIQNASTISGLTGSGGNDLLFNTGINPASKTYSFSVYLKGTGTLRLHLSNNVDNAASKIVTLTSSWIRYELIHTFNSTSSSLSALLDDNGATATEYNIYGAQLEEGGYPTSLIHTSGSTVTRNEDKALYAGLGTTDTFNDSEGVLFIETEALVNNNDARIISINAGNNSNRVTVGYPSSAASTISGYLQSTAGGGANMTITGVDTTQKHKVAIKYKLNDASLFIDGVKRAVDPSVAMPVGLKELDFSNGVGVGVAEYRGNLNAIAVYKTALTDTELANLTSYNNHDLFIPYRSRMQMINADQELQCTEHDITRFLWNQDY